MSCVLNFSLAQLQRLAITPSQLHNQQILLSAEQQHYLGRVLRLRGGDRFVAMEPQGQWWLAELISPQSAQILEPLPPAQTELPVEATLMVALPKGNGFDEIVRHCTEIGVSYMMPVLSERTLLNPSLQKLERWRRIAQEAAEQSERQIIPAIQEVNEFTTGLSFINSSFVKETDRQYICVARGESPHLLDCLLAEKPQISNLKSKIVIATGPEGGWTPAEVEAAIAAGFQPVSLGRRILRAVTAPVVALSLVASAWELKN